MVPTIRFVRRRKKNVLVLICVFVLFFATNSGDLCFESFFFLHNPVFQNQKICRYDAPLKTGGYGGGHELPGEVLHGRAV